MHCNTGGRCKQANSGAVQSSKKLAVATGGASHHHLVQQPSKQVGVAKKAGAVKGGSNIEPCGKTEESSPWVQSDGVKECVIEEVVDITVTGELEEALQRLLELLEELSIGGVEHQDLAASFFLSGFPLLV